MTTRTGRRLGNLDWDDAQGDAAAYLRRANAVDVIAAGKRARDALLGLRAGDRVLEIGCGLGDDVRRLATLVGEDGEAVGVDVSDALLERAAAADGPPVRWVVADAHALPLADASFAAARCERTLQHVADPAQVVAELARVVRGRGVVCLCEPDWATLGISGRDQAAIDAIRDAAGGAIRHARAGREVAGFLVDVGLTEVRVRAEAVAVRDAETLTALGDLPGLVGVCVADGTLDRVRGEELLAAVAADAAAGRLVATLTLVTAWGRV